MKRVLLVGLLSLFCEVGIASTKSLDSLKTSEQKFEQIKAQKQDPKVNIRFDSRFDGVYEAYDKEVQEDKAGFVGRYFKFILDGRITDKFQYSFRYRLYNRSLLPTEYFQNIDWANITWNINDNFFLTAGKQIVAVGGYEYDAAPIDMYFASNFWNNVSPYQIGVVGGYTSDNKKHTIKAQIVNSPFSDVALSSMFAYNFIWYGDFDWFKPIYSINMIEYRKDEFINYISLGNRFIVDDFTIDFDYMNRAGSTDNFFKDFSTSLKVNYAICDNFNIFVKGGYDQNKAQDPASFELGTSYDQLVKPGVAFGYYGLGLEYFAVKTARHNVRVHAFWFSNTEDKILVNNPLHTFDIGVKWEMTILNRE